MDEASTVSGARALVGDKRARDIIAAAAAKVEAGERSSWSIMQFVYGEVHRQGLADLAEAIRAGYVFLDVTPMPSSGPRWGFPK